MRILAVSGSLRAASSNSTLVRALASLAPEGVEVRIYGGLGDLPHFNPDLDVEPAPAAVADLRAELRDAGGVLICSPEYCARGAGRAQEHAGLGGRQRGAGRQARRPDQRLAPVHDAQAALAEILAVMTADLAAGASAAVPLAGRTLDEAGIAADPAISGGLRAALSALARAAEARIGRPPVT